MQRNPSSFSNTPRSVSPALQFPSFVATHSANILAMQFQLSQSERYSAQKLQELQSYQLSLQLNWALQNNPFYKHKYAEFEYSIERFNELPLTTRSEVHNADELIFNKQLPEKHELTRKVQTSGSTGVPVSVAVTQFHDFLWHATALREHHWAERDTNKKMGVIRWLDVPGADAGKNLATKNWGGVIEQVYDSAPGCALHIKTPLLQQVEWLLEQKPNYLLSYPSNIEAIARHFIEHELKAEFLDEIRTIGETLTPAQRQLFKHAFGARTYDTYSSEEFGYIAIQCPENDHYHIQSENVYVEVLRDDGSACDEGETGRLVISNLSNYATPLLRYEIGDYACVGPKSCSCGRTLPTLSRITGRQRNRIRYPDGREEFPYFGEHQEMTSLLGFNAKRFQVKQHAIDSLAVFYEMESPLTKEQEQLMRTSLQTNLGFNFKISFFYPEHITLGANGKFEEFICEI